MSHHASAPDADGQAWHAYFNSDLSGLVAIVGPPGRVEVPFAILKAVVAAWLRQQRINALEQADDDVVLKRESP